MYSWVNGFVNPSNEIPDLKTITAAKSWTASLGVIPNSLPMLL